MPPASLDASPSVQVHLQTKLIREGRLCAGDFPKAEVSDTCPVFKLVTVGNTFIYFPSTWEKNGGGGGGEDCLFQRVLEPIVQKRTLKKEKKGYCVKAQEVFRISLSCHYKHDLSLCSELPPLAFMVYFSFYY